MLFCITTVLQTGKLLIQSSILTVTVLLIMNLTMYEGLVNGLFMFFSVVLWSDCIKKYKTDKNIINIDHNFAVFLIMCE